MSKIAQSKEAQKVKKELEKLGVKKGYRVIQSEGLKDIQMWIYDSTLKSYMEDDNAVILQFSDNEYTNLTWECGAIILDNPKIQELADYLKNN